MQLIVNKVKNRINGHGRGWCFNSWHFKDLGNNASIRKILSRLELEGFIHRFTRGFYVFPKQHKELGSISPSVDDIAKAIAERDHIKIQPSGAYAANLLGLSEQVPAHIVYLTDGASRKIKIGKQAIIFKKTTAKNMANAGTTLGLIIQAIKYLGQNNLSNVVIKNLHKYLKFLSQKDIQDKTKHAPNWIRELILDLYNDDTMKLTERIN